MININSKYFWFLLTISILFFLFIQNTLCKEKELDKSFVSFTGEKGDFQLAVAGGAAPLLISSKDYQGVIRAVKDLQSDIENVTGSKPSISIDKLPNLKDIVLIGTINKSPLISKLLEDKKLNLDSIKGKWETFLISSVENPFPGVDRALVIAGSDKRGTIYGIYDLSEKIGVSPWNWWADVPVKKHSELYIRQGSYSNGTPAVKYRGIFLNDEAPALTGWANEKFGGLNHNFYEHVFNLILRLKGNYLWPAMWGNNFDDDDSLNQKLADEYGIVMGTSHHEPMMRSWKEWPKYGHGDWNYKTNDNILREYWREGIKRMNSYESIVTLGMRGDGDEAMSETANIGLMEKIISDQRKILADVTGKDVTAIPQVWALYKEVQEYYDKGMRVPDDVTLLLCDDNWGNIRKLPKLDAKQRKGGYGIYYHFDYVGGPRNYKWLNTIQIEKTWEQMHLAYKYGATQIWIVNVGDLKPMEFPISFFLDYAWNPDKYPAERLPDYYADWAEQQFGEKYAADIAHILMKYTKYNSRRKPELLSPGTYSLVNYREADRIVDEYNKLADHANEVYNSLPQDYKPAYYQLVLYPVIACANLNDMYVTAGLNKLYAEQGRALTDSLAEEVKMLFKKDAGYSHYYNKELSNGNWDHFMDQTHIGYTYWQQPETNNMPKVEKIDLPAQADMGVAIEGSANWWPEESEKAVLPEFDPYNKQLFYIDIFNRGKEPFKFSIETGKPFIKLSVNKGTVDKQKRIWISMNWDNVPEGDFKIPITIQASGQNKIIVEADVKNPPSPKPDNITGFIEGNGYVSIQADHFSRKISGAENSWQIIPNLGRTNSSIMPFPVTSNSRTPEGDSPRLEYDIYLFSKGEVKVNAYFSPTLNFHNSPEGIRYAVSFDDEEPQIINMTPNKNPADLNRDNLWAKWVSENINIEASKHNINEPGKHVLKFWMVDPGPVLQKIVIDAGGVKPGYLGPPESFHNNMNDSKAEL